MKPGLIHPPPLLLTASVLLTASLLLSAPLLAATARAGDPPPCHQNPPAAHDDVGRTTASYSIPDVTLVDQEGRPVGLPSLLESDAPVFLNFIFASCTTVCPVLTAGFAAFQRGLAARGANALLISITIDPEHDTPDVMRSYGQRFSAGDGWRFLTGRREDVEEVMRAFDVYVSNKMSHRPITFVRPAGAQEWTRIEGFMGVADYDAEYQAIRQVSGK